MKNLVIVESPTKARLVGRYAKPVLGDVVTRACFGHLRDLPQGELGIDVPMTSSRNMRSSLQERTSSRSCGLKSARRKLSIWPRIRIGKGRRWPGISIMSSSRS